MKLPQISLCGALAAVFLTVLTTVNAAPTVYIAGDSTVSNYRASMAPQQGWGARIPDYFTTGVTFSNRAIGGRSSKSFVVDGRLDSILSVIQPGDFLLVQFGHNDASSVPERHTDPFTTFKQYLRLYIDGAISRGATPVLITPMGRRSFDNTGRFKNDFPDYCTAMKQLAVEKNVKLIDLNTKSIAYYNSIGAEPSKNVFLWVTAGQFPGFPNGAQDNTHFKEFGANQIARLVTEGIQEANLSIRSFIKSNISGSALQAESALLTGGGVVESTNTGFRGTGYINFAATGSTLSFNNVSGNGGGQKNLQIRYALGTTAARAGTLVVNGVNRNISFASTGAWTTWQTLTVSVPLNNTGTNTIQLRSTGGDLANVDEIAVQ